MLIVNTFTPLFFFMIFRILARLEIEEIKKQCKEIFKPKQLLGMLAFVFGFSYISSRVLSLLGLEQSTITTLLLTLGIMLIIERIKSVSFSAIGIAASVLRLILNPGVLSQASFYAELGKIFFLFVLLRYVILNLSYEAFSKHIYIEDLKPGMCLANDIVKKTGKYYQKKEISISYLQSIYTKLSKQSQEEKSIVSDYRSLSRRDVNRIKKLHSAGKIQGHTILIHEQVHFALIMFLGVFLTLIARGNFLYALRIVVESFL
jgi:hypothetical protein